MVRNENRGDAHSRCAWILAFLSIIALTAGATAGPVAEFNGVTSPVSRESPRENFGRAGGIRTVSAIPETGGAIPTLMSGTVYYMVFERDDRNLQDPWGTGSLDFLKHFRAGIDFNGSSSPELDTTAKYLYLYQVINHQRTLPPIESSSVKLLVQLEEITSWGYFNGLGFATPERDGSPRPLSAIHRPDTRVYRSPAPALPLSQSLVLAAVPSARGEDPARTEKGKVVQIHWDALDPAMPPDYVMILGSSDFDKHPSFRAIWSGKNALGKDGRSTVFGFTSNLAPTLDAVRLRTSREETHKAASDGESEKSKERGREGSIRRVATEEGADLATVKSAALGEEDAGTGTALVGVEGRVATPQPASPASAFAAEAKSTEPPQGAATPNSGVPLVGQGLGDTRPSSSGGGGGVVPVATNAQQPTSSGGTLGSTGGQSTTGGTPTTSPASTRGSVSNTIDFNVSLVNQQSQLQAMRQAQGQRQFQHQSQGASHGKDRGGVVPEPVSVLGLAIGLPALLLAYRRRRAACDAPASPTLG